MAIKVNGTTVIDNSLNLTNIAGMTGVEYTGLHPTVTDLGTGTTEVLNFNNPVHEKVLAAATSFTESNKVKGRSTVLLLDTSATPYAPSFSSNIIFPNSLTPTWGDHRYWVVSFTCLNSDTVLAGAIGYDL